MSHQLDNLSLLEWLWHDSKLIEIAIRCRDDGLLTIALVCDLHPDEDRSVLTPYGIIASLVRVELHGAYDLEIRRLASTADPGVITDWKVKASNGWARHEIGLNTGAEIHCVCATTWLANGTA